MREHLKRSDIYVNPNNEVFVVVGFSPTDSEQFGLIRGVWYKLGDVIPFFTGGEDSVWIIQDGMSIPHEAKHFLSIIEWREGRLDKIGI